MSPTIHNAAFRACHIDGIYVALPVAAGDAAQAVAAMRAFDWYGLSVTMPHKHDIVAACDELTDAASALGAVNCVFWRDGAIVGDNTDGQGFVRGLEADLALSPQGLHCAVVGAGGAAKAVIRSLAEAGASQVTVVNRNADRADMAARLAGQAGRVGSHADLASADLVINSTPIGMAGVADASGTAAVDQVPFDVAMLAEHAVVADLIYHPAETKLLAAARSRGLRCQNGLPMLVHQAVAQFEHWTGMAAPVATMTESVTQVLRERS